MYTFWLILPALLMVTFFSGMGHALAASNKLKIELGSRQGRLSLQIQYLFLQHLVQFRLTMTIGYVLSIIGLIWLELVSSGTFLVNLNSSVLIFLLLHILVITFVIVFIVEVIARTLFRLNSNQILSFFSVPAYLCYILFSPIYWVTQIMLSLFFNKLSNHQIVEIYGNTSNEEWLMEPDKQPHEEENESQELKIFQNALVFSKVRIRDCMIPRTEIEAVDIKTGIGELSKKFINTGYSKLIVFVDRIDNIVGYINSKELFKHPARIEDKLKSISFVPETMPASILLKEFMRDHRSIVVVVDEYGGTSGIVTLEDIIEEIFGEIEDEHDIVETIEKMVRPNEYILSCRLEISYLNTKYDLHIPENENYDTLAGYILYHYHNLPKPNEIITIDMFIIKILKVSKNRIELAYIKLSNQ